MDKVQAYTICFLGLSLFLAGLMNGKERSVQYDWYDFIFEWVAILPLVGRIFRWW